MNGAISTPTEATPQQIWAAGSEQVHIEEPWPSVDVTVLPTPHESQREPQEYIRALSERLCEVHPAISTYEGVFEGIPHLKGLRISVADILEQLYLSGSISAVQRIYSPDVSEKQIKEAIAYAQDFVETVFCQSSEVNG